MVSYLELINSFCQKSHHSWVNQHQKTRGERTPRMKEMCGYKFDINTNWDDLCPLWRMKQRGDHEDYIKKLLPNIESSDIELISEKVHDIWMTNNIQYKQEEWCKDKFCPYENLPDNEKEFDREIAKILLTLK